MIKKETVKKNFSKSAESYDNYAIVQKHMAHQLANFLPILSGEIEILEIGAGTGIFTKLLLKKYPLAKITLLDISENMIEACRSKFGEQLDYIVDDAENFSTNKKFDLIVSNATFQWFNDLEKSLLNLKRFVKKNGNIYFSIFSEGTYKELSYSFNKFSNDYKYSQNFYSINLLANVGFVLKEEIFVEEFKSLFDFLKSIKKIGAQSSLKDRKILTPNILKKVEKIYLEEFNKIKASNYLTYVKI